MNILYISDALLSSDLPLRLKNEGHHVKLFINSPQSKNNLNNLIEKIDSWEGELGWVSKDGLIIFDDVGMGEIQDNLRRDGYIVFGGSMLGEKTETDREFGQNILKEYGLQTLPIYNFPSHTEAIKYIKQNPAPWVVKYSNGHIAKNYCYIGEDLDGKDTIIALQNSIKLGIQDGQVVSLQKRIYGVEIGIGRYFNGNDWASPIEYNLEHTHLCDGDIGPKVDEMGTLGWYSDDENELLYEKILAPIKPFLQKADFRGDFEINCIVNEDGIFPLEVTARLGTPIIHIHEEIHNSPWGEFMHAVAKGNKYNLSWKKGFAIAVSISTVPFPYSFIKEGDAMIGLPVTIDSSTIEEKFSGIHLEEVASRDGTINTLEISGSMGKTIYVTGFGNTVHEAQKEAYERVKRVHVPKMFYRHDIGNNFIRTQLSYLQKLGYLKNIK